MRQCLGGAEICLPQSLPFHVRPALELGSARRGEIWHEVTAVRFDSPLEVATLDCCEKCIAISFDPVRQRDGAVARCNEVGAETLADIPQGLTKGAATRLGFTIRPQKVDQMSIREIPNTVEILLELLRSDNWNPKVISKSLQQRQVYTTEKEVADILLRYDLKKNS